MSSNALTILTALKELIEAHDSYTPFDEPITIAPTGSRVICDPPVMDTDEDWLVYMPEQCMDMATAALEACGATFNPEQTHYPDGVVMWIGNINVILIHDYAIFYRWVIATYWAKQLNLLAKEDRVRYFQSTVDARSPIDEFVLKGD